MLWITNSLSHNKLWKYCSVSYLDTYTNTILTKYCSLVAKNGLRPASHSRSHSWPNLPWPGIACLLLTTSHHSLPSAAIPSGLVDSISSWCGHLPTLPKYPLTHLFVCARRHDGSTASAYVHMVNFFSQFFFCFILVDRRDTKAVFPSHSLGVLFIIIFRFSVFGR